MNFWKIIQGGYEFVRINPFFSWLPSTVSNEIPAESAYYAVVSNQLPLDGSRAIQLDTGQVINNPTTWFTKVFRISVIVIIVIIVMFVIKKFKKLLL